MAKQITKKEALDCLTDLLEMSNKNHFGMVNIGIVKQYIEQDSLPSVEPIVEAKSLEEIEEHITAFVECNTDIVWNDYPGSTIDKTRLFLEIKQACKQYSISKDKEIEILILNEEANKAYYADTLAEATREIESLRQTVSDLSQKLDMQETN